MTARKFLEFKNTKLDGISIRIDQITVVSNIAKKEDSGTFAFRLFLGNIPIDVLTQPFYEIEAGSLSEAEAARRQVIAQVGGVEVIDLKKAKPKKAGAR